MAWTSMKRRRERAAVIAAETVNRAVDEEAAVLARQAEQRNRDEANPDVVEAARLLGMKRSEILNVEDAREGVLVTLFDGTKFIIVPEDRPDPDGQSGLMTFGPTSRYSTLPAYAH